MNNTCETINIATASSDWSQYFEELFTYNASTPTTPHVFAKLMPGLFRRIETPARNPRLAVRRRQLARGRKISADALAVAATRYDWSM